MRDAQDLRRGGRLRQPLLRTARSRRRLAVGEIDDADAMPLRREVPQRALGAQRHRLEPARRLGHAGIHRTRRCAARVKHGLRLELCEARLGGGKLRTHLDEQRVWWPVDTPTDELAAALVPLHHTSLGPLAGGLTLGDIGLPDRLCELDFEIPLAGGDARSPSATAAEVTLADVGDLLVNNGTNWVNVNEVDGGGP